MRVSQGAAIAPADVIGRDDLVQQLKRVLETSSVLLLAERRIGKTTVLSVLESELRDDGHLVLRRDLEGYGSVQEFVRRVGHDALGCLTGLSQIRGAAKDYADRLGKLQAGDWTLGGAFDRTWGEALDDAVGGLLATSGDKLVVLLWDEFPMMLQAWLREPSAAKPAADLLDQLRRLRQTSPRLRLVLTGSIGLHHVLRPLGKSASTNDMAEVTVPPLLPADGAHLASLLLLGEDFTSQERDLADAISAAVDHVPHYIHGLVGALLPDRQAALDADDVARARLACLRTPDDRWDMRHFRERLQGHYAGRQKLARHALDCAAGESEGVSLEQVLAYAAGQGMRVERGDMRQLLDDLVLDHYLQIDAEAATYRFRFGVVRDWWRWQSGYDQ